MFRDPWGLQGNEQLSRPTLWTCNYQDRFSYFVIGLEGLGTWPPLHATRHWPGELICLIAVECCEFPFVFTDSPNVDLTRRGSLANKAHLDLTGLFVVSGREKETLPF